jgi:anti-sigma factor RsiW
VNSRHVGNNRGRSAVVLLSVVLSQEQTVTAVTARARLVCLDVEPLLSPFVDNELLEDDQQAVRLHVEGCASCNHRLAELRRTKAALKLAVDAVELPPGLLDQVRDNVEREGRNGRVARGVVFAAVLAAALGATAWMLVPPKPAPAVPPRVVAAVLDRHRLELPVDVASPEPRRVQEFLTAKMGHPFVVPRLEGLGWGLLGGRIVDVAERRGAHLTYTGGYGQRLSVVVLPDPDDSLGASAASTATADDEGLRVRLIARDHTLYSFVGDVDDARLARLSDVLER